MRLIHIGLVITYAVGLLAILVLILNGTKSISIDSNWSNVVIALLGFIGVFLGAYLASALSDYQKAEQEKTDKKNFIDTLTRSLQEELIQNLECAHFTAVMNLSEHGATTTDVTTHLILGLRRSVGESIINTGQIFEFPHELKADWIIGVGDPRKELLNLYSIFTDVEYFVTKAIRIKEQIILSSGQTTHPAIVSYYTDIFEACEKFPQILKQRIPTAIAMVEEIRKKNELSPVVTIEKQGPLLKKITFPPRPSGRLTYIEFHQEQ